MPPKMKGAPPKMMGKPPAPPPAALTPNSQAAADAAAAEAAALRKQKYQEWLAANDAPPEDDGIVVTDMGVFRTAEFKRDLEACPCARAPRHTCDESRPRSRASRVTQGTRPRGARATRATRATRARVPPRAGSVAGRAGDVTVHDVASCRGRLRDARGPCGGRR